MIQTFLSDKDSVMEVIMKGIDTFLFVRFEI